MVRSLAEKYAFITEKIEELGLKIHPTSRLALEARPFIGKNGLLSREVAPGDPDFRAALEAKRDFTLFEFILGDWPFPLSHGDATSRLKMALKDAVDPYAPGKNTPGRDTQLELFVAVTLSRAGLAVELGSPDLRVRLGGQFFYVEAKRTKTRQAIKSAISRAADQIKKSGCPGAVFLDSTMAFNPTDGQVLRIMPDEEFSRLHGEALNLGIATVERDVLSAVEKSRIVAVSFQDHQHRQIIGGWRLESCCSTFVLPGLPKALKRLAQDYQRSLDFGWPK